MKSKSSSKKLEYTIEKKEEIAENKESGTLNEAKGELLDIDKLIIESNSDSVKVKDDIITNTNTNIPTTINHNLFPENNKFIETLSMFYICKIWNLWELVITETPIVVYSDLPSTCRYT